MWSEKKFVVEIDEKYFDQKKHQIVTYKIGKAYDKYIYFSSSTKIKKKIVGRSSQKKRLFSCGGKKKVANNTKSSPTPISNGSSLTPERLNYVTVFSVEAVLPWKLQLRLEIKYNADCLIFFSNI